jgi:hypothetical protein
VLRWDPASSLGVPKNCSFITRFNKAARHSLDECCVAAHRRARARLLDGCPSALVRILSYTAHSRWGSAPPRRPVRDAHALFDRIASMGGPAWRSTFVSPARRGGPRAPARTCAPNRWHTRAGTLPSERRNRAVARALTRQRSAASPAAPHAPARGPAAGPRVLFPMARRRRTLVSNDSLESTGRPAALSRPWLCPGRPATQLKR